MKMLIAYIRPAMKDAVVTRLRRMDVPGASLSRVDGFGLEADETGEESYGPQVSPYTVTMRLEVACPDDRAAELAEAIADEAHTGRRGDGKVYALPIDGGLDIRTQAWTDQEAPADA